MRACFVRFHVTLTVFVVTALIAVGAAADIRLDPRVAPDFEAITLDLDADRIDYTGSVRIELTVREPTSEFQFHAEEMTLDRVEISGPRGLVGVEIEDGEEGIRRVTCAQELARGSYVLEIDFHKDYNTQAVGLYRTEDDGRGYLFTQFEAVDARKAFPCWDEPIFKHEWQLSITVPMQHTAVSNMPVEREAIGATTRTYRYKRTPPMPSYLLCIAAGPLESVAIPKLSVPGRIYTVKGQKRLTRLAAEYAPPILAALEEYFGREYPYEKLDLIAIPEYWPGAMENPGAVTYSDELLLIDPKAASVSQKASLAHVHAHEFAHMWFGDLVTMAWWDDLWLNESFAEWLGDKVTDQVFPEFKHQLSQLQELQRRMKGDARPSTTPVRKPVDSTDDIMDGVMLTYAKGKTVLAMVEMWIGEDTFRNGVRSYIERHAWGSTRAADLFTALSQAADQDLTPILAGFLDQPGYPLVRVEVGSGGVLTVSQKRFVNAGVEAEDLSWTVPVRLKFSDGETIQTRTLLLDGESERVEVASDVEWAMPNESAYGYYRWSAPSDMIFKIAADPEVTMNERERAVFMANVGALLDAGELAGDDYLAILGSLARHPRPEVIAGVMDGLGVVYFAFVNESVRDGFAHYVRETLEPTLDLYGMSASEGEPETVTLMRPRLMRWLGGPGQHEAVRAECQKVAAAYMDDPSSVDATLAGSALIVAARGGGEAEFEVYLEKFESSEVPADRSRYLTALSFFPDPKLQDRVLDYIMSGNVRPNEVFAATRGIAISEEGRGKITRWIMDNYEAITNRIPRPYHLYLPYFASGCSRERLAAAQAFFAEPAHNAEGTQRTMAKVADQVMDCVNLREREGERVAQFLGELSMSR